MFWVIVLLALILAALIFGGEAVSGFIGGVGRLLGIGVGVITLIVIGVKASGLRTDELLLPVFVVGLVGAIIWLVKGSAAK